MEPEFWHQRWENNEIGFHLEDANPMLTRHIDRLTLRDGARLFLPLCGKTRDIHWLRKQGFRVAGIELSPIAVEQLFDELGIAPTITETQGVTHYHAERIDIFLGDFFALSAAVLGPVDAIYDRAALVALPSELRRRYGAHLRAVTNTAPQLLITFVYDQSAMEGPPFSISDAEVHGHYRDHYDVERLTTLEVEGGLKGKCAAQESVWLLRAV